LKWFSLPLAIFPKSGLQEQLKRFFSHDNIGLTFMVQIAHVFSSFGGRQLPLVGIRAVRIGRDDLDWATLHSLRD
jgi:hypothetical protein